MKKILRINMSGAYKYVTEGNNIMGMPPLSNDIKDARVFDSSDQINGFLQTVVWDFEVLDI